MRLQARKATFKINKILKAPSLFESGAIQSPWMSCCGYLLCFVIVVDLISAMHILAWTVFKGQCLSSTLQNGFQICPSFEYIEMPRGTHTTLAGRGAQGLAIAHHAKTHPHVVRKGSPRQ